VIFCPWPVATLSKNRSAPPLKVTYRLVATTWSILAMSKRHHHCQSARCWATDTDNKQRRRIAWSSVLEVRVPVLFNQTTSVDRISIQFVNWLFKLPLELIARASTFVNAALLLRQYGVVNIVSSNFLTPIYLFTTVCRFISFSMQFSARWNDIRFNVCRIYNFVVFIIVINA